MTGDWKDILGQLRDDLPEAPDNCEPDMETGINDTAPGNKETIRLIMEKKGRKGKTATIAEGFKCDDDELQELASKAKRHLGVGGSARGGEILIQGDCRERLAAFLRTQGYKVK